mmetsp:Transcript_108086/g.304463  ORF Transcript_108086/g.304463 Transcript_108086/m.304463 type:complete len:95 (+) Transcript_108086:449-733(+)
MRRDAGRRRDVAMELPVPLWEALRCLSLSQDMLPAAAKELLLAEAEASWWCAPPPPLPCGLGAFGFGGINGRWCVSSACASAIGLLLSNEAAPM